MVPCVCICIKVPIIEKGQSPREAFFLALEALAWFRGDQSVCRDNLTIMKGSPCLGLDLLHYATKGI